jgi:hypothetical protein
MKKALVALAVPVLLAAVPSGAAAAKAVPYVGKTSSGHKVTFKVKRGRIHDMRAGIRMACIPIQGGGRNLGGGEKFGFSGSLRLKRHNTFSYMDKPAFHWREATWKSNLWLKRRGRTISGRMRLQYSFLISKYPIGTFSVYSCAGGATFKARPRR